MEPIQDSTNSTTSFAVTFERNEAGEIARRIVQDGWLDHTRHIWTTEQQTGHPVCAWCGFCNGGC
jgi:hypothetical protein